MRNDIKLYEPIESKFTTRPIVDANNSAGWKISGVGQILAGTPTKLGSTGYVGPMVDADGTNGIQFTGIAKSDSTETTSVDGRVEVYLPLPGLIYAGAAKTAANADTQAEIDALYCKRVIFDLTSDVWTVDTGASDASTNCLIIVGGDYNTSTIYFAYGTGGTLLG
jgi:hypothetical protein